MPRILLAALLLFPPLYAGDTKCNLPVVTIYVNEKVHVPLYERARAIFVATRAFREIGVQLNWRDGAAPLNLEPPSCARADIIELQVDRTAEADTPPDVLAHAIPASNSGASIHVSRDRVARLSAQVPNL